MPEAKRFLLRLDPKLFEALRRWANDDLRSINAQIEYLLTQEVRRAGRLRSRRPNRSDAANESRLTGHDPGKLAVLPLICRCGAI
jgi:hypothetical protein